MSITQTFDLNLIPEQAPVVVHCDQYDEGTGRLIIKLFEGDVAYTPTGTASIQGRKPDGHGFQYSATLVGNTVTADLTFQMSCVSGRVRCQVVVTESTGRTGTFAFILDVQPSALPSDTDLSDSDYQLIEQALEAAEDAVDAAEDAEAWAVGERGGVPVGPTDPTYHNNSEYWAQQAAIYAQGGWHYMGSIPFADLPTTGMVGGDMYNITDDFVTDSRFIEGSGKQCYAGQNVAWVASVSKWDLPAVPHIVPDMTSSTKGIGRPDGKTTEVSSGVFNAIGVSIPAEVNSGATQYASNWLYYEGTTEVITPSTKQNYRVIESGTAKLYYWTGSAYAELTSGGGGGGGMNTDGSNAASAIVFPSNSIASGSYAKSDGGLAFCNQTLEESETSANLITIPANTTTETKIKTYSLTTYPFQRYWLDNQGSRITVDATFSSDQTLSYDNKTIRVHRNNNNIELWATNTTASSFYVRCNIQGFTHSYKDGLAMGGDCVAYGKDSVAIGNGSRANGDYSQAFGDRSVASGASSHAEGFNTYVSGNYSHTEGIQTQVSGVCSHAEGIQTLASSEYQHAEGKFNVEDTLGKYAWIVGNGTAANARSNAAALDWSGNLEVAGNVKGKFNKVTSLSVDLTGWTSDTTSQSGTTLYKKQISLNHVYVESPTVDIGSSGVLPTVAEQESYNLLQYVTVDDTVPCLYLYASAIPTTAFYISVKGVD